MYLEVFKNQSPQKWKIQILSIHREGSLLKWQLLSLAWGVTSFWRQTCESAVPGEQRNLLFRASHASIAVRDKSKYQVGIRQAADVEQVQEKPESEVLKDPIL